MWKKRYHSVIFAEVVVIQWNCVFVCAVEDSFCDCCSSVRINQCGFHQGGDRPSPKCSRCNTKAWFKTFFYQKCINAAVRQSNMLLRWHSLSDLWEASIGLCSVKLGQRYRYSLEIQTALIISWTQIGWSMLEPNLTLLKDSWSLLLWSNKWQCTWKDEVGGNEKKRVKGCEEGFKIIISHQQWILRVCKHTKKECSNPLTGSY